MANAAKITITAYIKSYSVYWSVPKYMTLNDVAPLPLR